MVVEMRLTGHGVSLRLGRLFLRSWAPYGLELPTNYEGPFAVYLVERVDERDESVGQLGGFTTLEAAQECIARLDSEGEANLRVNHVAIHQRVDDWHFDR